MALVLAMLLALCSMPALAAAQPTIVPQTLWVGDGHLMPPTYRHVPASAELISVKSSRPGVIQVVKINDGMYGTVLRALKPGKSVITVKYRANGKTQVDDD